MDQFSQYVTEHEIDTLTDTVLDRLLADCAHPAASTTGILSTLGFNKTAIKDKLIVMRQAAKDDSEDKLKLAWIVKNWEKLPTTDIP
jgi:hypothetical protein